jgi:hypothetical protein
MFRRWAGVALKATFLGGYGALGRRSMASGINYTVPRSLLCLFGVAVAVDSGIKTPEFFWPRTWARPGQSFNWICPILTLTDLWFDHVDDEGGTMAGYCLPWDQIVQDLSSASSHDYHWRTTCSLSLFMFGCQSARILLRFWSYMADLSSTN